MTPTKHPLSWFIERIGKTVVRVVNGIQSVTIIQDDTHARGMHNWQNAISYTFRDPHPLTSSILTCNVLRCDTCGYKGDTEDLDKEVAAKGFEGEGWKLDKLGMVHCGCKIKQY